MRDNPNLSSEQIDRIRSVAQLRSVQAGEVLYEPSQPDVPLFIVLEGSVCRLAKPERSGLRTPSYWTIKDLSSRVTILRVYQLRISGRYIERLSC